MMPGDRYSEGYDTGRRRAGEIAGQLEKGETVKIFSHSMGGAFGAGFASALQHAGVEVEFHLAIAPFQSDKIATGDVTTYQVGDDDDPVAGPPRIPNVVRLRKTRRNQPYSWHRFTDRLTRRHLIDDYDAESDMRNVKEHQKAEEQN